MTLTTKLSPEELSTFKVSVKETLQVGPVIVTFTKKDGTERVMKCTLSPSLVVHESKPVIEGVEKKVRKQSEEALAVYDLENNAWKSFRWDSIVNMEEISNV